MNSIFTASLRAFFIGIYMAFVAKTGICLFPQVLRATLSGDYLMGFVLAHIFIFVLLLPLWCIYLGDVLERRLTNGWASHLVSIQLAMAFLSLGVLGFATWIWVLTGDFITIARVARYSSLTGLCAYVISLWYGHRIGIPPQLGWWKHATLLFVFLSLVLPFSYVPEGVALALCYLGIVDPVALIAGGSFLLSTSSSIADLRGTSAGDAEVIAGIVVAETAGYAYFENALTAFYNSPYMPLPSESSLTWCVGLFEACGGMELATGDNGITSALASIPSSRVDIATLTRFGSLVGFGEVTSAGWAIHTPEEFALLMHLLNGNITLVSNVAHLHHIIVGWNAVAGLEGSLLEAIDIDDFRVAPSLYSSWLSGYTCGRFTFSAQFPDSLRTGSRVLFEVWAKDGIGVNDVVFGEFGKLFTDLGAAAPHTTCLAEGYTRLSFMGGKHWNFDGPLFQYFLRFPLVGVAVTVYRRFIAVIARIQSGDAKDPVMRAELKIQGRAINTGKKGKKG